MPSISDYNAVKFVPVFKMKLEQPSIIVSGQIKDASGDFKQIPQFKFHIDDDTDIEDVNFVVCNKMRCSKDDISYFTAGLSMKRRDANEKFSDIFGHKGREGDANRFMRREMMQCTVWPSGYDDKQAARFAKMFDGPNKKNNQGGSLEEEEPSLAPVDDAPPLSSEGSSMALTSSSSLSAATPMD